MNDLQEQLAGSGIEYEDSTIDGFCGQVSFESFVNGHSIHVGIINKPDNLIRKQFRIILGG